MTASSIIGSRALGRRERAKRRMRRVYLPSLLSGRLVMRRRDEGVGRCGEVAMRGGMARRRMNVLSVETSAWTRNESS